MKNNFIENCKQTLGTKINDFIRNKSTHKGKKARIKFAEEVNKLLNINNFDEQSNYKKVSRWISGESFPDFITIVAISRVMGISLDELFNDDIASLSQIHQLSPEEIIILKKLIANANNDKTVNIYIPYAFQGKRVYIKKDLLTREEIIKLYKQKATKAFMLDILNEYTLKINDSKLENAKHFSRLCSVEFIENEENNNDMPKSIFYTNKDDYYKNISKIWEKQEEDNFYNVIFFEERQFDFDDTLATDTEKAYYYKTNATAKKIYNNYFNRLITKGILEPIIFDFSFDPFDFEFNSEEPINKRINTGKVVSIFTDNDYEYNLETVTFSFKINMSNIEMQEILKIKSK